jgi:glycosyltransferase involved in cell wall biosynthesis
MKILFVASYYLPYVSGLTIHAQRLAEGLAARGHWVEVISNSHCRDIPREETLKGVSIKRAAPLFRFSRGYISPNLFNLFLRELPKCQVVALHLPLPEAFIFAPLAKLRRKKVIFIYHANLNLPSWSVFSRSIEGLVLFNHLVAGFFADRIIAYSEDYANFAVFLKTFRQKIVVIYPPVLMRIPNQTVAQKWKKSLGLEGNKIIGFAGRFAEEKGGDILIEAIPYLLKRIPRAKVVFAGEVNLAYEDFYKRKKSLIDRYKNRIVFLGLVPPEKMPEFYAMCDVLALPSRAECFGLVQVEAMLCGTPVVAFNIPGGRVPVLLTGMGRLATKIDSSILAKSIIEVTENKKIFWRSRKTIGRIFNFEKTLDNYEKLFKEN